jgi:hypothetical protein
LEPLVLFWCQLHFQGEYDLLPDLILQGKELGQRPVIALAPQMLILRLLEKII